jgi:hypothetical protein
VRERSLITRKGRRAVKYMCVECCSLPKVKGTRYNKRFLLKRKCRCAVVCVCVVRCCLHKVKVKRYNISGEIKKSVIIIERCKMSEPMDIPEGGGGSGVKGDGEKGEKVNFSSNLPNCGNVYTESLIKLKSGVTCATSNRDKYLPYNAKGDGMKYVTNTLSIYVPHWLNMCTKSSLVKRKSGLVCASANRDNHLAFNAKDDGKIYDKNTLSIFVPQCLNRYIEAIIVLRYSIKTCLNVGREGQLGKCEIYIKCLLNVAVSYIRYRE